MKNTNIATYNSKGLPHGYWEISINNKPVYKGYWDNGRRVGLWRSYGWESYINNKTYYIL